MPENEDTLEATMVAMFGIIHSLLSSTPEIEHERIINELKEEYDNDVVDFAVIIYKLGINFADDKVKEYFENNPADLSLLFNEYNKYIISRQYDYETVSSIVSRMVSSFSSNSFQNAHQVEDYSDVEERLRELEGKTMEKELEAFVREVAESKPQGSEVAISQLVMRIVKKTSGIDRVIYTHTVLQLLGDPTKLFPRYIIDKLEKLYAIALGLKNAKRIRREGIAYVSVSFPFSGDEYDKYFYFVDNLNEILKFTPLSVREKRKLIKSKNVIEEIFYRGITERSFEKLLTMFENEAHNITNEIARVIMANMRNVRYYIEKMVIH